LSRRITSLLMATAVAAGLLVGAGAVATSQPATALDGSQFDPGNIISDQVFFNGGAMSEGQIQGFLDARIGSCTNGNCLNVKRIDTQSRAADQMCGAYQGAAQEPASRIIAKVAQACGINPQVLLVTLQKEQSLVSGSIARGPSDARLERAMGYACPDSANGGCDPSFGGVYNQLYKASWQFKRYANPPGTSKFFTQYAPGGTRNVLYNPNSACGSRPVYIANQATANLYYYTPYTPNAAALANLNGTGDTCSAYGNRNFWVYFNDWFGSTVGDTKPIGSLDSVVAGQEVVTVRGWTFDRDVSTPIPVHVYVDSVGYPSVANASRPDVGAAHPSKGSSHGFEVTVPAPAGARQVCVYAIGANGNGNGTLGCRQVTVSTASPIGNLETVQAAPGGFQARGWALDTDTAASIPVHLYVDATPTAVLADGARTDIAAAYPNWGPRHGFDARLASGGGSHRVCAYGINQGRGSNALVGCTTATALGSAPVGNFESATGTATGVSVAGWAIDGDTADSLAVHVYVDGVGYPVNAAGARDDLARAYPAYGAAHGFAAEIPTSPGVHTVCAYAINKGIGTDNTTLGCRSVTVAGALPVGNFESLSATSGSVQATGWAVDPDAAGPVTVRIDVDGVATERRAELTRADVGRAWPALGAQHGFSESVAAAPGSHRVCVTAVDTAQRGTTSLGCRTVTVP